VFLATVPEIRSADPWQQSFKQRFDLLTRKHRRIAYLYHEPDNSTFRYRIYNMTQVINETACDTSASWFCFADTAAALNRAIDAADVLVLCRMQYSAQVGRLIDRARMRGIPVLFDTDDLVFDTDYIPLIMTTLDQELGENGPWDYWYAYVGRIGATLRSCDRAIVTNAYLGERLERDTGMTAHVVPNFLNREQLDISNRILAEKRRTGFSRNGRTHIGYFSGSPSHNRDLAIVATTLARLLDEEPCIGVRLVGYVNPEGPLLKYADRVEIHPFCDFVNLQRLVGSTEINIVPLQDNVFTNCKSDLKYFEAGAVGTVTIASPTFSYGRTMIDGVNGFLAAEFAWENKIRVALDLLSGNAKRYIAVAEAANMHATREFSWRNQLDAITQALFPAREVQKQGASAIAGPGPAMTSRVQVSGKCSGSRSPGGD
jgi:glycosyltransferase involved in cell wall biosynthesis